MKKLYQLTTNFVVKNVFAFIMLFIFILFASFFEIYPVVFMQQIVDGLTQSSGFNALMLLLVYWYACRLCEAMFSALSGRMSASLSSRYSKLLRKSIFDKMSMSTYAITEDKNMAENIYASIEDVNSLGAVILSPIQYIAQNLCIFIWSSAYLIKLDYVLYFFCVPLGIIMWLSGNFVSKKNRRNEEMKKCSESGIADIIGNFFSGLREILTLGLVDRFRDAFQNLNEELCNRQYKSGWLQSALSSLLNMLWPIATVITLGIGGYRVSSENLSIGGLVAFMWYVQWAINPVSQFAIYKYQIKAASVAYKRISELFESYGDNTRSKQEYLPQISEISLEGVSYFYKNGGRGVKDVSVSFKQGVFYSLVGKTGSGKSTIGKLINGLYMPTSGTIKLNGTEVRPAGLLGSRQIMSAFSDAHIFSGSMVDNITLFSDRGMVQEDNLDDIFSILNLEDLRTIDNLSSQGEHSLSTGQKQRIAIGRVFYQNPDVLVIDEATSAIDSNTERAILDKLAELSSNHIIILISHRWSSVLRTDYCYMVDDGEIVCQGKPERLINQSVVFKELFFDQVMNGEED